MVKPSVRVQDAGDSHDVRDAMARGLVRLFVGRLVGVEVRGDGVQEFLAMIAQFLLGHRRMRRHERSRECTEIADDFAVIALNEHPERLRYL